MRGDEISPKYVFDKKYSIFLPNRDNWLTKNVRYHLFHRWVKAPWSRPDGSYSIYSQRTNQVYNPVRYVYNCISGRSISAPALKPY